MKGCLYSCHCAPTRVDSAGCQRHDDANGVLNEGAGWRKVAALLAALKDLRLGGCGEAGMGGLGAEGAWGGWGTLPLLLVGCCAAGWSSHVSPCRPFPPSPPHTHAHIRHTAPRPPLTWRQERCVVHEGCCMKRSAALPHMREAVPCAARAVYMCARM